MAMTPPFASHTGDRVPLLLWMLRALRKGGGQRRRGWFCPCAAHSMRASSAPQSAAMLQQALGFRRLVAFQAV